MSEYKHYENPELWTPDRFTQKHEVDRFQTCFKLIPDEISSLLDVGCGNGAFMAFLEAKSVPYSLLGLERSESAQKAKVCRSEIRNGSIDSLPFNDVSFDLVAAMEVIEHLPYGIYEKALTEIQRVAESYVLISVPYREYRNYVECPYCNCKFNSNYHLRSFDEAKLKSLFSDFQLINLVNVKVDDYLLAPLLRYTYRIISGNRDFPRTAVCPHCGFTGWNLENETLKTTTHQVRSKLRDVWKERSPKYKKPTWFVALYERIK